MGTWGVTELQQRTQAGAKSKYSQGKKGWRGEDVGSDGAGPRPGGVRGLPHLLGHRVHQWRHRPRHRGSHRSVRAEALDIIAQRGLCDEEEENLQKLLKFTVYSAVVCTVEC